MITLSVPPLAVFKINSAARWVGRDHLEQSGEVGWKLPNFYGFPALSLEFALCFSFLFFCSYIANQKRLEIINEDDLEAYVGLKNL